MAARAVKLANCHITNLLKADSLIPLGGGITIAGVYQGALSTLRSIP